MRTVLLVLALLCAVCVGVQAARVYQQDLQYNYITYDAYLAEEIEISGCIHKFVHVTNDKNGGLHVKYHINSKNLEAVGLMSGRKYKVNWTWNATLNVKPPYPWVDHDTDHWHLVGPGKGNNHSIKMVHHVRVDANGDVTCSFYKAK